MMLTLDDLNSLFPYYFFSFPAVSVVASRIGAARAETTLYLCI